MRILRQWFNIFQEKLIESKKMNSGSNRITQDPPLGLFRLDLIGKVVLDCVPEHFTFFGWSSTNGIRRWMNLKLVSSTLKYLPTPNFGRLFVGVHYDNKSLHLVPLDKQLFNALNEPIILSFGKGNNNLAANIASLSHSTSIIEEPLILSGTWV